MSLDPSTYVQIRPDGTKIVREASVELLYDDNVFYNPIQQFNRDMSIAAIRVWSEMFLLEKLLKYQKKNNLPCYKYVESLQLNVENNKKKKKEKLDAMFKNSREIQFERVDLNSRDFDGFSIKILEALAATGLRSLRYAKEIPRVEKIIANDLLLEATESIARNAKFNGVDQIVQANQGNAVHVLYQSIINGDTFDVIDLDPYGSSVPFIDGAVQVVSNGGLLAITCTDLSVLAGSQSESCWSKYGGGNIPNSPFTHEMALRILLNTIQSAAAKYKRAIQPLASFSIDYYVRVFVRVYDSPSLVKQAASKSGIVFNCVGCRSFTVQPIGVYESKENSIKTRPAVGPIQDKKCGICQSSCHIGGPAYIDKMHNKEFLCRMLEHVAKNHDRYATFERMAGMLMVAYEELPNPFYYRLTNLCNVIHSISPPYNQILSAICNAGFKVSQSHAAAQAIKTDAPASIVWDIIKACYEQNEKNKKKDLGNNPVVSRILGREKSITVDFTPNPSAEPDSIKYKFLRFQQNPAPNWGPQARPKKRKQGSE